MVIDVIDQIDQKFDRDYPVKKLVCIIIKILGIIIEFLSHLLFNNKRASLLIISQQ